MLDLNQGHMNPLGCVLAAYGRTLCSTVMPACKLLLQAQRSFTCEARGTCEASLATEAGGASEAG